MLLRLRVACFTKETAQNAKSAGRGEQRTVAVKPLRIAERREKALPTLRVAVNGGKRNEIVRFLSSEGKSCAVKW